MIVKTKTYTRAGLAGNPSDGYFGKTLSVTFRNFYAEVTMYETPDLEILPNDRDHSYFNNLEHLVRDVRRHGYYGGIRLIKAAAKKFFDYCGEKGIVLPDRNFTVRYRSNIPVQVGLAGSSAIVTAMNPRVDDFLRRGNSQTSDPQPHPQCRNRRTANFRRFTGSRGPGL